MRINTGALALLLGSTAIAFRTADAFSAPAGSFCRLPQVGKTTTTTALGATFLKTIGVKKLLTRTEEEDGESSGNDSYGDFQGSASSGPMPVSPPSYAPPGYGANGANDANGANSSYDYMNGQTNGYTNEQTNGYANEQTNGSSNKLWDLEDQLRSMEVEHGKKLMNIDKEVHPKIIKAEQEARAAEEKAKAAAATVKELEYVLQVKEEQQRATVTALREEMKRHQEDVKQTQDEMTKQALRFREEITKLKMEAVKEKAEITQRYKAEEAALQSQISTLKNSLATQKQQVQATQNTVATMQQQITQKDQQVQTTMQQLKQQANEYGSTMEQIKAQSEKEKSAILQFHKAEEQTLKEQIDELKKSLASQDQVAQASRSTVEEMQKQIAQKEQEMNASREKLQQQLSLYGSQFEEIKTAAYQEKMAIAEKAKAQEMELQRQINTLRASLASQQDIAQASRNAVGDMRRKIDEKEQELREKAVELGTELTYMKLMAHREKMEAIADYKQREVDLQDEVQRLRATLSHYGIRSSSIGGQN